MIPGAANDVEPSAFDGRRELRAANLGRVEVDAKPDTRRRGSHSYNGCSKNMGYSGINKGRRQYNGGQRFGGQP